MASTIYIAIGSNVGDRLAHLKWAVMKLIKYPEIDVLRVSSVYESEAHTLDGDYNQDAYLNGVIELRSQLDPLDLLDVCLALETERGRVRQLGVRWEPRTLDLDILAIGGLTFFSDPLVLPHPRLAERRFVLEPWNEIAPGFDVPGPFGRKVADLLIDCADFAGLEKTAFQLLD